MKHVTCMCTVCVPDRYSFFASTVSPPTPTRARGSRRGDRRTTWFTASSLRSLLRDVAPRRTREARASAGCDDPSRPPVRSKPTPTRCASARTSRFPLDWRSGRAAPCFRMPCFRTKALGVSSILSVSRPPRAPSLIFSRWVRASFRFLTRCSLCTPPETPFVSSSPSEVSFRRCSRGFVVVAELVSAKRRGEKRRNRRSPTDDIV